MKPIHPDARPRRRTRGHWLAAAVLTGLVTLGLSACSKQPDPGAPAAGGPAAQDKEKALEAARRQQSANNLTQIMLALHNYHSTYKRLPPAAILDKQTGKPLLSWRVAILPYLEQGPLFQQFKLDEPWDSPHNKKLAETVIPVYAAPGAPAGDAKTFYRALVAPPESTAQAATAMRTLPDKNAHLGARGTNLIGIRDGTSNTIGVVEAGEAVPWAKPDELVYDGKSPLPKFGGIFKDGFHAAMMDGSVRFFPNQIDERSLRAFITRNGGEVIRLEKDGLVK